MTDPKSHTGKGRVPHLPSGGLSWSPTQTTTLYFSLMSWFTFSCWCMGQLLDSCHKTEIEQVKQNIWPGWRSSCWHTFTSRDFVQLFWREKKLIEILCLPGWWKLSKDGHKYGKSCSHFRGQGEETIRCLGWQETHTPNRNVFYLLWV